MLYDRLHGGVDVWRSKIELCCRLEIPVRLLDIAVWRRPAIKFSPNLLPLNDRKAVLECRSPTKSKK